MRVIKNSLWKNHPVLFLTLSCVLVEINLLYCFTFGFRLFFKICDLQVVKFESNVKECDPLDCALNLKIKELMQMKILNKRKWFCHSEIIQLICFSALLCCSSQSPPWQNLLLPKAIPPNLVTQREQQQCKWVKFTFFCLFNSGFLALDALGEFVCRFLGLFCCHLMLWEPALRWGGLAKRSWSHLYF